MSDRSEQVEARPKVTVEIEGRHAPGEEIPFEVEREDWNTYKLADGTRIKMKNVVATVYRLDEYKENGDPVYVVNGSAVMASVVPDSLKKKPGSSGEAGA